MAATREQRLLRAFAALADTLVAGYDVVDMLQNLVDTCSDLLGASAAGVLLADGDGDLDLVVSTSEASRLVEVMQLSAYAGPCIDSYRFGRVVSVPDIRTSPSSWHDFTVRATEQGFLAIDAIPLRLRENTIGTLNLMRTQTGELSEDDMVAAQAFADVATISILHERTLARSNEVREQLQHALNSRVVIEQAKGVIAYKRSIGIEQAFELLRTYARNHQLGIAAVAKAVVEQKLEL
ncbi:GAF and ANTAR domain-containing protein [Leifsonia sp. fls2-241-R2A-40a]|uniref:GAF and ANTAR domain-containing protein n=1 Tax=Leifsonia sp. fls2-241-R2A-40a TaxID=3040290 RepID=UPI0025508517|nr:GAF and ANTAR domain-containing protein [Leifsonia sp. fls2-241-R2A-40a]